MFYVKKKISDGVEINIDIKYDNVYTRCPRCGVEFEIDITEFSNYELEDTAVYCEKCSAN